MAQLRRAAPPRTPALGRSVLPRRSPPQDRDRIAPASRGGYRPRGGSEQEGANVHGRGSPESVWDSDKTARRPPQRATPKKGLPIRHSGGKALEMSRDAPKEDDFTQRRRGAETQRRRDAASVMNGRAKKAGFHAEARRRGGPYSSPRLLGILPAQRNWVHRARASSRRTRGISASLREPFFPSPRLCVNKFLPSVFRGK